jgi:predicted flavoprotein YhiN
MFSENEIILILSKSTNTTEALKKMKLPLPFIYWCKHYLSKSQFTDDAFLFDLIKRFPVYVESFRPIEEAISCAGGVSWDELNENLQLKKFPNVSIVGEMIDWEAPTGGYLLQGAFSTGFTAGS